MSRSASPGAGGKKKKKKNDAWEEKERPLRDDFSTPPVRITRMIIITYQYNCINELLGMRII